MKNKIALMLLCFNALMISSCAYHPIELPNEPEAPPAKTKTLKQEIEDAIKNSEPAPILEHSVPIIDVWNQINYKSYAYSTFFYFFCPSEYQTAPAQIYDCSHPSKNFTITKNNNGSVLVEIKNFSANEINIQAIWEVQGQETDFTIKKYEKTEDYGWTKYIKAETRFFLKNGRANIKANGVITNGSRVYYFETKDIYFDKCNNLPNGKIFIQGANEATVYFYYSQKYGCDTCARAEIDGIPASYSHCYDWILIDLFDYIKT